MSAKPGVRLSERAEKPRSWRGSPSARQARWNHIGQAAHVIAKPDEPRVRSSNARASSSSTRRGRTRDTAEERAIEAHHAVSGVSPRSRASRTSCDSRRISARATACRTT